jgi:hypothetical protein
MSSINQAKLIYMFGMYGQFHKNLLSVCLLHCLNKWLMLPVSLNEICVPIPAQLKQHPVSRIKTSQTQTIKRHHRHNRCFNRLAVVFTEQPKDGWGLLKLESMKYPCLLIFIVFEISLLYLMIFRN